MLKRLKQFFESLAYAGLRPSGGKPLNLSQPKKPGWFGQRLEKFLVSGGQSDPLYLSNRTFMQKAGIWLARRGMMSLSLPLSSADYDTLVAAVDEFAASRGDLLH